MRNLTVRERAGLAAIVLALAVVALGGWVYRQQREARSPSPLMPIAPPEASTEVEVPARGPDSAPADETRPDVGVTAPDAPQTSPNAPIVM